MKKQFYFLANLDVREGGGWVQVVKKKRGQKRITYGMEGWGSNVLILSDLDKIKSIRSNSWRYRHQSGVHCSTIIECEKSPRKISVEKVNGAKKYKIKKEGVHVATVETMKTNRSLYKARLVGRHLYWTDGMNLNTALLTVIMYLTKGRVLQRLHKTVSDRVYSIETPDVEAENDSDYLKMMILMSAILKKSVDTGKGDNYDPRLHTAGTESDYRLELQRIARAVVDDESAIRVMRKLIADGIVFRQIKDTRLGEILPS